MRVINRDVNIFINTYNFDDVVEKKILKAINQYYVSKTKTTHGYLLKLDTAAGEKISLLDFSNIIKSILPDYEILLYKTDKNVLGFLPYKMNNPIITE